MPHNAAVQAHSTYDLFLAVSSACVSIDRLVGVGSDATARTLGVDLYYRPETDVALLCLRLDARSATHTFLDKLRAEAHTAGAAVLEPARLEEGDRDRFYREHLSTYTLRVTSFPTVADAARKLSTDLGLGSSSPVAGDSPRVRVRYRRGDRWQLSRPRSLSREGIYLYAATPPRQGDVTSILLETAGTALTLRAAVVHVTPEEVAPTVGGPGFAARFFIEKPDERHALETLVVAGRADGLGTLRPAPSRREARYPVRWPVSVGRSAPVPALDVSRHGLFVAMQAPINDETVEVRVAADDQGPAIRARARVARALDTPAAEARGMSPGYGLEMCGFAPGDDDRFASFVSRVGQRALHRLLVGASERRLKSLAVPLAAAGYVVTGFNNAVDLVRQAEAAPPDLVFLDHDFARGRLARTTLCYTLENTHTGKEIRALADAALLD